ncbi:hypothetical protein E4U42_007731 [Claviceps africana]|uniref:J domain-containing protein n=1 Tax=Claviceps africana TaxID=83212 RepID=A0A8K0J3I1_9HYPO|nr:hypothetical protein E4U42_007731 [Claviceps africana]
MSEDNKELVRLAGEFADQDVDLYALLGVDALTPKEDIHRAWRKRSLKHHPDKAGANFDAQTWEMFERARDVLSEPGARAVYDQASRAKLLRRQEREAMDKERQRFADDLEAREEAARRVRDHKEQSRRAGLERERERLAEEQRMREEEVRRRAEAAQEVEDLAEARRRLKEKRDEKARRRQAKESMKTTLGSVGKAKGPANGVVNVPGDYVAGGEDADKQYWELVCDKLRAVQTLRGLQRVQEPTTADALDDAERHVQRARQRIHDAEMKYQGEMPMA